VVIPCGKSKIWGKPRRLAQLSDAVVVGEGAQAQVQARFAYTSSLFSLYLKFAEKFGGAFRILSAKYGLLEGRALIADYDASFSRLCGLAISQGELTSQARLIDWSMYSKILILGGKAYRQRAIQMLPQEHHARAVCPFEGLGLFQLQRALADSLSNPERFLHNIAS